jgi:hypothetical protein
MACGGGFNDRDQLARNRDAALALEAGAVRWFFHLIATAASGLKVRGRTLATSAMSATFVRNRYGADTADGLTEFGKGRRELSVRSRGALSGWVPACWSP